MSDERQVFVYIIDTSSIIDLFRLYPRDIFAELWKNIDNLIAEKRLISHKYVFKELKKRSDNAFEWARERRKIFKRITKRQLEIIREVVSRYPLLVHVGEEIDADPWLIALALEKEKQQQRLTQPAVKVIRILTTEEKYKPNKINIPYVCQEYKIEYTNLIGMIRKEGWKWENKK